MANESIRELANVLSMATARLSGDPQRMQMALGMQQSRKLQQQEKNISNYAANYLETLGASPDQIKLVSQTPSLAKSIIQKQFEVQGNTALIENTQHLTRLREKFALETDPKQKTIIQQQIKDFSALGNLGKNDPTVKFNIVQAEQLARQGLDLGDRPMTAGDLKTDESFAPIYTKYIKDGRGATNLTNLERLRSAEQILKIADQQGIDISGITAGMISGIPTLEAFLNEQGFISRETVESVIQQSLRQTLGAQFGEKEGEQFIRRGYNPSLSPAENLERLIDLRAQVEQLVDSEKESIDYWENNKTLRGYKGQQYTMDSFVRDLATDYKRDVMDLSEDELVKAYRDALEDSTWEKAIEKEINRRNR
jgi:dsRNA-specific ribonuclease